MPADAWEPDDATAYTQTQAPETMEAIVAQFEAAKSFHDTWRNRIFLPGVSSENNGQ
jgi:hypothetical protein